MSGHCIVLSLSTNLHQVWRQPFTCIVVVDWSVVYLCVWQRNSQESRRQGSKREHTGRPATVRYRLLSDPSCSIVTSRPVTSGLIGAAVACAWCRWPGTRQQLFAHGPLAFELEKGRLQTKKQKRNSSARLRDCGSNAVVCIQQKKSKNDA